MDDKFINSISVSFYFTVLLTDIKKCVAFILIQTFSTFVLLIGG